MNCFKSCSVAFSWLRLYLRSYWHWMETISNVWMALGWTAVSQMNS